MIRRSDPKTAAIAYTIECFPRGYRLVMLYPSPRHSRFEGSYKSKEEIELYVRRFFPTLPRVADRFSKPAL
jgi:hypothetical protein